MIKQDKINNIMSKFKKLKLNSDVKFMTDKITVTCEEHGDFITTLKYLNKNKFGCYKCYFENNKEKFSKNESYLNNIFENLNNMYPNLDFSKFVYKNNTKKSIVICPEHGEFEQSYNNFIKNKKRNKNSIGCPYCAKCKVKDPIDNLQNKFPNLDFSKFVYNGKDAKSTVICKEHGEFLSSYHNLMSKNVKIGCHFCSHIKTYNPIDNLQNKFPNLDFSKFEYISYSKKSVIICPEHGEFLNSYEYLISKDNIYGCKKCSNSGISSYEDELFEFISSFYNKEIKRNYRGLIKNERSKRKTSLELDFYLPEINLAIEFNGSYWHSDISVSKRKYFIDSKDLDNYKIEQCNKIGVDLIHIMEQDYLNNKIYINNFLQNKIKGIIL